MKKIALMTLVLFVAVMAQAQTKIAAQLQNGYKAVYISEQTVGSVDSGNKIISETEMVVSDVTATGAVITATTLDVKTEGDADELVIAALSDKAMRGVSVRLSTDADGKVTGILNMDEVRQRGSQAVETVADALYNENPSMAQTAPKELLVSQVMNIFSEETLLTTFAEVGLLALNGKTPMNGAVDHVTINGLKLKRMYFVAGNNIITNATLDMTRDELKEFVISKVAELAPDQVEVIRQSIDMVMGQMKFEMTYKSTYELQSNGWVKSLKVETTQDLMGQSSTQILTFTLKE